MVGGNETELSEETSFDKFRKLQVSVLKEKKDECDQIIRLDSTSFAPLNGRCSPVWDNVFCWPEAKAGAVISVPCPDYIYGFNQYEKASRFCTENGTWFINPSTQLEWTDYSACINGTSGSQHHLIQQWLPIIKRISQVGYSLSFVTLVIAFIILISIKKLRCPRNTLHMHLFVSFMLRAFMALFKDTVFIDGIGPQSMVDANFNQEVQANWGCKLLTTLWQYFIVANYSWILMEGLYLHNLIFLAPFSDSSAITTYVLLGWGLPLPVVGTWVACRIYLDDTLCWTTHHAFADLFLIIRIPIIVSIVLNFLFFVNITRVLLVKLQSAVSIETRKYRYRKWAKSTLVLVPLFGVHYMMFVGMSYYMGKNQLIEVIWLFCDQLFGCFQGCLVAILYCLMNGEVSSEIGKKWRNWRSDSESKNVWVPLNHITSRLNHHRSTQEIGMSGTSVAGVFSNCTATKPHLALGEKGRLEQEVTEEHQMEIT